MEFPQVVLAVVLTKSAPDLIVRLRDALDEPIDSYWNGSHTWFGEYLGHDLEYRLHPVSGFVMPDASRPEDLFELAVEGNVDPEHYWEGLEVFPIDDDIETELTGEELSRHIHELLGVAPDACGTVDHDEIGNAYEHATGNVSIVSLLLEQIKSL